MSKRTLNLSAALALLTFASPALAEPVTIRWAHKDIALSNPADVAHIERIEKAMAARGVDIDLQLVELPYEGYAEKLGVMILSGDVPDLIYFQGTGTGPAGDEKVAEQGLLEDLRPLIDGTTHLKKALWPHNVDRLSHYPYLMHVFAVRVWQPVIRKDWLEKAGVGVPETVDDYVELLKALRDKDLDGDGQNNTFGITTAGTTAELDAVFNMAFGIEATWLKNDKGEWINARVSQQEKEKLAFYRSLYDQGLLDPEFITTKFAVKEDKFYTGRVGMVMASSPESVDIYHGKMRQVHPDAELQILPPPRGVKQGLAAVDVSKETRGFGISTLAKNKKEIVALLDFLASPEGQMLDRLGFEGEHYTKDGDKITLTPAFPTWYARFISAQPEAWKPPVPLHTEAGEQILEQAAKFYRADNAFVFPFEYAADIDAAESAYRSNVFRFISGERPLDDWDGFVEEWNAAGGTRMTEYARTVLDAGK